MQYSVHFEASAAVGIELAVEADSREEAEAKAKALWVEKSIAERVGHLVDIDKHAREGFAQALGVDIPYATINVDDFEHVDTFKTAERVP